MVKLKLFFHPEATEEYIASFVWYSQRGRHLADAFEAEVERAVRLIAESPDRWPVYENKYRRVVVRRFPYSLVYQQDDNRIVILAVAHGHRLPEYWKHRTSDN